MVAPLILAVEQSQRSRAATRRLTMTDRAASEGTGTGDLAAALHDAVALFRELKIGYALIGGLAAMVYGRARYTEDIDFVAAGDHAATLEANPDTMRRHGFDPASTWKLYHRSGVDIDLWKDAHAPQIVARAVRRKLGHRFVKVAEPHDLIAMKLRADRPRDDYDIAEVLRAQDIDEDRLAALVTQKQLRRFRAIRRRIDRSAE